MQDITYNNYYTLYNTSVSDNNDNFINNIS